MDGSTTDYNKWATEHEQPANEKGDEDCVTLNREELGSPKNVISRNNSSASLED